MNTNITLPTGLSRVFGRGKLLAQKHSPEILLGIGIVGVVTATVMACKATLKVEEVKSGIEEERKLIEETNDRHIRFVENTVKGVDPTEYTKEDYEKDLTIHRVRNIVKWGKLYAPAAAVGLASVAAIVGSHGIMAKRTASLVAAYGLLQEGFAAYRKRVVEDLGEDQDKVYRYGLEKELVEGKVVDEETGKKKKVKSVKLTSDPNGLSDYARFFDEYSVQYRNDPSLNLFFLKSAQNQLNDKLRAEGHLFLNEAYDLLGLPRTKAGAIVGWVWGTKDEKDGFVDLGLYEVYNAAAVNGYETVFILDPNVDGVIYDLLPS